MKPLPTLPLTPEDMNCELLRRVRCDRAADVALAVWMFHECRAGGYMADRRDADLMLWAYFHGRLAIPMGPRGDCLWEFGRGCVGWGLSE